MKKFCNCCGKEIQFRQETGIALEDYVSIDKSWGYFSNKDGIRQRMNVCEACFDSWVRGFSLAPEEGNQQEWL